MKIKFSIWSLLILIAAIPALSQNTLQVVTTLSTYADIARQIGGDRVEVKSIVAGNQDAHFIQPKPSYAVWLADADLFIETGLDLELWVPALMDKSGNSQIRSGQKGYVSAAANIRLLEVPVSADRSQGDVHIYGNPHITTSPLNIAVIADNIAAGLSNVDPGGKTFYQDRVNTYKDSLFERLFGKKLLQILGADILVDLTQSGNLISFLEEQSFQEEPLINYLD
ncbi:MAG: metal ABC transporter substrate-binding protein, partial [Calditrichia bacterium]